MKTEKVTTRTMEKKNERNKIKRSPIFSLKKKEVELVGQKERRGETFVAQRLS